MRIISIEPTPSPNTMKINLDEELPMGKSNNYKQENKEDAPEIIRTILSIEGIKGVYHVADFLAVERNARFDWKDLLAQVRHAFGEEAEELLADNKANDHFGEIKVFVQMYKGIPMQIKLSDGEEEKRYGLPDQFMKAVTEVRMPNDNVVTSRRWKEFGVRYGEFDEIGNVMVEELLAAYPDNRIESLVKLAKNPETSDETKIIRQKTKLTLEDLDHPDWKIRYQKLEQSEDPTVDDIPVLTKALDDEKPSIRRLATVYLGMIEDKNVLPSLYKALKDKTITVRRTAGDCLSDLGFPEAMPEMMQALSDSSKLVRWRAAMYLYEVGDERALAALKDHENDPEFEVSLQIKLAIERIELGEEAKGSVWKQMTEARK
ncbi:conserved virulence factor C family protein [Niallia sp. 01092]|uniref:conserved virulence factor C family protein n=1 Tax=unclassified Niallia TaxID=2837522 RepID=UPI003FD0A517